jgi:hypothetical protein
MDALVLVCRQFFPSGLQQLVGAYYGRPYRGEIVSDIVIGHRLAGGKVVEVLPTPLGYLAFVERAGTATATFLSWDGRDLGPLGVFLRFDLPKFGGDHERNLMRRRLALQLVESDSLAITLYNLTRLFQLRDDGKYQKSSTIHRDSSLSGAQQLNILVAPQHFYASEIELDKSARRWTVATDETRAAIRIQNWIPIGAVRLCCCDGVLYVASTMTSPTVEAISVIVRVDRTAVVSACAQVDGEITIGLTLNGDQTMLLWTIQLQTMCVMRREFKDGTLSAPVATPIPKKYHGERLDPKGKESLRVHACRFMAQAATPIVYSHPKNINQFIAVFPVASGKYWGRAALILE